MPLKPVHPTETQLLFLLDGELPPAEKLEISRHLESCWTCRERLRATESTILDFVRARNEVLDAALPSVAGPRALLRARLEQEALLQSAPSRLWGYARTAAVCCSLLGAFLLIFEFRVRADGPQPDASLTPGEVRPISLVQVCRNEEAEVVVANISDDTRRRVFAAYGINPGRPGDYEVDYLITPDLGGSDSIRNLWPQPYSARWSAKEKDKLEQRLHQLVCAGTMDLATAQHEIAGNWIEAYKKYVRTSTR
jgi:hypothetical protein